MKSFNDLSDFEIKQIEQEVGSFEGESLDGSSFDGFKQTREDFLKDSEFCHKENLEHEFGLLLGDNVSGSYY